ncbi:MAG: hypothetical protein QXU18_05115 [Thermoplasmatales archaeon]
MNEDKTKKDELLYRMYREVVGLEGYIHDTAQRSLLAISFLILAGATVFGGTLFLSVRRPVDVNLLFADYIIFFVFVLFIGLGTCITLIGLLPYFNVPKDWKRRNENEPESIYFGLMIGKYSRNKWVEYLSSISTDALISKSIDDLSYEIHLIAEKIDKKKKSVKAGLILFIFSSVVLVLMVLVLAIFLALNML